MKHSSLLLPGEVDVRQVMALSLPHRSSNQLHIYSSDSSILLELQNLVAAHMVTRIRCIPSLGRVYLPKTFRRNKRGLMMWRKDVASAKRELGRSSLDDGVGEGDRTSHVCADDAEGRRASNLSDPSDGSAERHSALRGWIQHWYCPPPPCEGDAAGRTPPGQFRPRQTGPQRSSTGRASSELVLDAEDSSGWDTIAADASRVRTCLPRIVILTSFPADSQPATLPPSFPFSESCGDDSVDEELLTRMRGALYSGVDIKDRQYHFRTYKDCFLGRWVRHS